jgi:putative aldouronate transport system substrate-binding protein
MAKRSLMVLLSLVLAIGLLAACAKNNTSSGGQNSPTPKPTNAATNAPSEAPVEDKGSKITDDPMELTIHMHYGNRFAFDDNWSIFKKAADLTNISLKGISPTTGSNSGEMSNLMLAAGKLPDIIHLYFAAADQWGPDGVLIDLKDLIDEHAPNIKQLFDENPRLRNFATATDGNIYFVPQPNRGTVSKGWMIRQDWLDEVNLPIPKTYEDFYNTLKAFKEKDPKRYPYIGRGEDPLKDLMIFWGVPGGPLSTNFKAVDNEVSYMPGTTNFKTAVQNVAKWYKEGLIDQEIFTRGPQSREIMFGDNLGGVTHDFMQSTAGFNDSLKDKLPDFNIVAMPPPQDVNGNHVEGSASNFYFPHGWGISSQSNNAVEVIKYFDFWFSEEGKNLSTYGVEGETYTIENGEIDLTDSVKDGNILENLYKVGAQLEFPRESDPTFIRFTTVGEALKGLNMYAENNYMMEQFPPLKFSVDEKKRFDELSAAIGTYVNENFQRWIMGAQILDDAVWDNYTRELDKLGVKELTELAQVSYNRQTSN